MGPVVYISYSNQTPICPSLWFSQCQATGNEVFVSPDGGMKRGICFTAVGDKAAEEIKHERKPAHEKIRDMSKKLLGDIVRELEGNV